MPIIIQEQRIEAAKEVTDLRPILQELVRAVNILYDTKNEFKGNVVLKDGRLVMKRTSLGASSGDEHMVALTPTGLSSTTTEWEDLGKRG